MSVAAKKLTWDNIKDWPEDAGRTAIVDGELVRSSTPTTRHQKICALLGAEIFLFVRQNNLGEFLSSPMHVILAPERVRLAAPEGSGQRCRQRTGKPGTRASYYAGLTSLRWSSAASCGS